MRGKSQTPEDGAAMVPLATGESLVNFYASDTTMCLGPPRYDSIAQSKLSTMAQTFSKKLLETHHNLKKMGITHVFYLSGLILYTLGGGAVFYLLDSDSMTAYDLWEERCIFNRTEVFQNIVLNCNATDLAKCAQLQQFLVDTENCTTTRPSLPMSYPNAVVFAGSVYTTIGYGLVHPVSTTSKVATFIYTIVGIPYFLAVLQAFGRWLQSSFQRIWRCFWQQIRRRMLRMRRQSIDSGQPMSVNWLKPYSYRHSRWIPLLIGFCVTIAYLIAISAIFRWLAVSHDDGTFSMLDSFHFVLQSVTLVGFGDVYPKNAHIVCYFAPLILIGSFFMSMCFFILQEAVMEKAYGASERVSASVKVLGRRVSQNAASLYGLHNRGRSLSPGRENGHHRSRSYDEEDPSERHRNTIIKKWRYLAHEVMKTKGTQMTPDSEQPPSDLAGNPPQPPPSEQNNHVLPNGDASPGLVAP